MDVDALIAQLIVDEGVRLKPYMDSRSVETIGIGRNLRDVGISEDEARYMCLNDVTRVQSQLDASFPWWRQLDDDRQQVIANMAFNLGIMRLKGFHDMLVALEAGDYNEAANQMLKSMWAAQVGARAQRLAARMRGTA